MTRSKTDKLGRYYLLKQENKVIKKKFTDINYDITNGYLPTIKYKFPALMYM